MPNLSRRFLIAASACLAGGGAKAASKQQPPPSSPLVIGAALPLSGELSLIGDECLRGIQLAAAARNASGGIAGKLVSFALADALDQDHAAAAVNALISQNQAGIVLSGGASEISYSGSAAAELAQIPFIELDAPADGITARSFKFLLRTGPTTTMIGNLAVSSIQKRFAGRKIGLLFNTGATAGAIAAAALAAFSAANIPIMLAIGYPDDVVDLYAPVGRLKRAGVEVMLHAAGPEDVLAFYTAMQEQAWRPAAVLGCSHGYPLSETAYALGPAFNGTFVIDAPYYPQPAAGIAAAYQARFGVPPRSPDSLTAFVGAKLVFDTLNAVHGDPTKLLDAMRKLDIPAGGLSNGFGAAFDSSGQNTRSFVTLQQWHGQTLTAVV